MSKTPLHDERGKWSMARILLAVLVAYVLRLIWIDSTQQSVTVENAAYSLLSGLLLAIIAWAGGPRAMQYFGPQLGAFAQGVANAARAILPSRKDDERVDYDPAVHR